MKSESLSTLSRISWFISLVCFVAMVKKNAEAKGVNGVHIEDFIQKPEAVVHFNVFF